MAWEPKASTFSFSKATSAVVSEVKWLMATTQGRPNCPWMLFKWRSRLTKPRSSAPKSSMPKSFTSTPPWDFNARTVATSTTASGCMPALRHLMSMNFSAPKSAPKPASVTTISANFKAVLVAMTVLQPWAMLANGPPWTNTGLFSKVCTKLGRSASFNKAAIAPWALISRAKMALLSPSV